MYCKAGICHVTCDSHFECYVCCVWNGNDDAGSWVTGLQVGSRVLKTVIDRTQSESKNLSIKSNQLHEVNTRIVETAVVSRTWLVQ